MECKQNPRSSKKKKQFLLSQDAGLPSCLILPFKADTQAAPVGIVSRV